MKGTVSSSRSIRELPQGLRWAWRILAFPTVLIAVVSFWTRTWGPWLGSPVDLNGLFHWHPVVMLLLAGAYALMVGWVAMASVLVATRGFHGHFRLVSLVVMTSVLLGVPVAPTVLIEAPFVMLLGGGRSPAEFLRIAADKRSRMLVGSLLSRGVDINARASTGDAAIGQAACEDDADFVSWLIDHGADPNVRGGLGYSPITCAVANRHLEVVRILLARGADPRSRTDSGKSVLDLAVEAGDPEIVATIRDAVAKK